MFVVFDLDGTLALNEHRQHHVEKPAGEKKDWKAFYEACDKDELYWQIALVLRAMRDFGHEVEIWSGRSAEVLGKSMAWLYRYELDHVPFRCRAEGDHTPDHELKKKWLDEAPKKPDLVFDDRASVVAMWRENGIACCQVAPGNF